MPDFDPQNLTDAQKQYLREHALELWQATMCPPNDEIEHILNANCPCCQARKAFVRQVMAA